MIAHIRGIVAMKGGKVVVVEAAGVGYRIFATPDLLRTLPVIGQETLVHTYHVVREDSQELYGFASASEREFFEMLITVPGVGPRTAIGILGLAPMETLRRAIASGEHTYLTKMGGVGKKTAEKIIVELRDRLGSFESSGASQHDADALDALMSLGYNRDESREALREVGEEGDIRARISDALKRLGKHK